MALRRVAPNESARAVAQAAETSGGMPLIEAGDDPLSPARGILYAAIGGAAVWAALIGGAVAVIQRLR
jgi:hypothetical protein